MIIEIDKELKKIDYYGNGSELATILGRGRKDGKRFDEYTLEDTQFITSIEDPVLMMDDAKIGAADPKIRSTLMALYSTSRKTTYDGVSIYWNPERHKNVWSFSIDTGLFLRGTNKIMHTFKSYKTAADLGSGSGHIGKYMLAKLPHLEHLLFVDLNKYAITCCKDNINDPRASFYTGNAFDAIEKKKFDLLLCNPPYIPRPESIEDNPYEGVGLLYRILHEGQEHINADGAIITNISSLCKDIVLDDKIKMNISVLDTMKVPLKINNLKWDDEWMEYLMKRGLKKELHDGHDYWHTLTIYKLTQ